MNKLIYQKKRVTFFLPSLAGGGAEKVFLNIALFIANKKKYDVNLITLKKNNDFKIDFYKHNINYICLNSNRSHHAILKIWSILKKNQSEIYLSTILHLNILIYIANIFLRRKIIYRESNNLEQNLKSKNILKTIILFFFAKLIYKNNYVIVPSDGLKHQIKNLLKINSNFIFKINNPISEPIFNNEINNDLINFIDNLKKKFDKIIINVGSLTKQKNHEFLIKSYEKIAHKHNACLIIFGKGELRKQLVNLIFKKKLQNKIFLRNFDNNFSYAIKNSNLFVSTSLWEGFPNVFLDAASNEIPILALNCDFGPSEILENGKYGYLCNLDEKESFYLCIHKALLNSYNIIPKTYLYNKYGIDNIGSKYLNLIELI